MDTVQVLWTIGNVLLIWVLVVCVVFPILYPILFDPNATTAGKAIWRVGLSLAGVMLVVFVGIFVDRPLAWWVPSDGTDLWRVILRALVYLGVAIAMTNLNVVLILRKFRPASVKTAPPDEDTNDLRPWRKR